jgi:hypothetical protein
MISYCLDERFADAGDAASNFDYRDDANSKPKGLGHGEGSPCKLDYDSLDCWRRAMVGKI